MLTAGLNNAGARPGASWKRPGGGSCFPWVEGRLSGWCEEKPGPGSGGECRRERGRSLLQEVGGGGCGGGQEIRFPGSTLLGVSVQDLLPPVPWLWSCPCPGIHPIQGSARIPRSSPRWGGVGVGGAVCEDLGLRAGLKGQWGTLCPRPGQPPSLSSQALRGPLVGRKRELGITTPARPESGVHPEGQGK